MRAPHQTVRVMYITPGGVEGRGGMGRMARYFLAAFRCMPDLEVRVLDPYGPGHSGKCRSISLAVWFRCRSHARVAAWTSHTSICPSVEGREEAGFDACSSLFRCANNCARSWFRVCCLRRSVKSPLTWNTGEGNGTRSAHRHIGRFWRQYLVERLEIEDRKVIVVANGVPLPTAVPPAQMAPAASYILAHSATRKGTSDLLRALASPAFACCNGMPS